MNLVKFTESCNLHIQHHLFKKNLNFFKLQICIQNKYVIGWGCFRLKKLLPSFKIPDLTIN